MYGAVIGDIAGSVYEWKNVKTKDFELFRKRSRCTDDSVMTVNHDGDSDSTGGICGNILGALHGYEALPGDWKEQVELHEFILQMADALCDATAE